ncbi:MAG: DUF937 domain-containing protein [Hyphomicrobiaceae bacterium]
MTTHDLLSSPEGRAFVDAVARTYDLDAKSARAAVSGLIPELVNGLERNTLSRGGLADLLGALATGGHERYVGQADILGNREIMADGKRILRHLFTSEGSARRSLAFVESETGVPRSILWQILPGVAALLIGWLAKSAKGGLGDVLSQVPKRLNPPGETGWPRDLQLPPSEGPSTQTAGGDIFPPMPDLDRLPKSGPYGDLSDILKRGGRGSGSLASIVRDLIGGLLGFGSKGVVGWVVRLILVRYGWRILGWVVRRIFLGR